MSKLYNDKEIFGRGICVKEDDEDVSVFDVTDDFEDEKDNWDIEELEGSEGEYDSYVPITDIETKEEKKKKDELMLKEFRELQINQPWNNNYIGERIAYLREVIFGKSVGEFAKIVGINRVSLYKIEKGKYNPSLKVLKRIVDAFEIDMELFCAFPEDMEHWKEIEFLSETPMNIFKIKQNVLNDLDSILVYYKKKKAIYLPKKYSQIIRKQVEAAFEILDLLEPDAEQHTDSGYNNYFI